MFRILLFLPVALIFSFQVQAQPVHDLPLFSKTTSRKADTFSKGSLPVYKIGTYVDGLYRTYESFAAQKPDTLIAGIVDKERLRKAWYLTPDNEKGALIDPATIYAVVFKGTIYISTKWGYFPTYRKNGEYSFSAYSPTGCKELGGMKINYRTGQLMPAQ